MQRLWRWFWTGDGHAHQWEIVQVCSVHDDDLVIGDSYIMRCQHCGSMKVFHAY
jgi:hypothetical protein